jgi:protocatechuate 3,4-dioxygenase beta subunit
LFVGNLLGQDIMENDDATVGRIFSRREAISVASRAGFGLVVFGGPLCGAMGNTPLSPSPEVHLVASPSLEEGPFFVDERLNRSNLVGQTLREAVAKGIPLDLKFTLYHAYGEKFSPMEGAQVDVWQADGHGVYSDESNPMNFENTSHENWLRGYQVSGGDGVVRFRTILPGWYEGRTAHIHLKIRRFSVSGRKTSEFTTQVFFDDHLMDQIYAKPPYNTRGTRNVRNQNDHVYNVLGADGSPAGGLTTLKLSSNPSSGSYISNFSIALTSENERGPNGSHGRRRSAPLGGFGPFSGG